VGGKIRFEDLSEGFSFREEVDEATGITNRVVVDWRGGAKTTDLRPAMAVTEEGAYKKLASGGDAKYTLPVGAILSVGDGDEVRPGDVIARLPTESAKTRDITGGLPRVAELFEARRPKDCAVIAEMSGRVEFGKDYKNKRRIKITPDGDEGEPVEFLIPKGKHIQVHDGDFVTKGEYIIDGSPDPHDLLRIQGVEALAEYLVNEIQEVYRLQGVPINDKHIETIVRQMLQKLEVVEPGDTGLIRGDHLDKPEIEEENAKAESRGGRPALTQAVLLGITKASLQTRSFISAASFQETTRVLTDAAVHGKKDTLEGLKENVIVGRLIPAGTGAYLRSLQKIAAKRDEALTAQREEAMEAFPVEIEATPEPVSAAE
jgi:DNA-directed RNA polymerase subunit beta'